MAINRASHGNGRQFTDCRPVSQYDECANLILDQVEAWVGAPLPSHNRSRGMNIVVWIVSGLLAAMFLLAGSMKLAKSKEQLVADPKMGWAEPFPEGLIKFIGAAEVAGAVGLILPGVFDIATWLVPAAAIGLAVIMAGAAVTHGRRGEWSNVVMTVVLLALAVFVAVERIGPHAF
ncbi:DoxX family protein [Nocardia sp. NPDC055002]